MAIEQISGAASGAMTGAKIGSAILPGVGTVVGGILGGVAGLFGSKKTAAPKPQALDIAKLVEDARKNAEQNLAGQLQLEQKYLPQQAAFRQAADAGLAQQAQRMGSSSYVAELLRGMGNATQYLPEGSVAKQLLDEAKLGGALTPDVQAQIAKTALEGAGRAGISGSMAGRGLVARDIGMTSEAIRRQRLAQALGIEQSAAQNYLLGEQLQGQNILNLGTQSAARQLPQAGLSPQAITDMQVADFNRMEDLKQAQQQSGKAGLFDLFGQITGFAKEGGFDPLKDLFKKAPGFPVGTTITSPGGAGLSSPTAGSYLGTFGLG